MSHAEEPLNGAVLVLPSDSLIQSMSELPESIRRRMNLQPGDYLASRAGLSSPTSVLDEAGASLILEFREPRRLVDAVIQYSRRTGGKPEQVLEESISLIRHLVGTGVLARCASPQSAPITPLLHPGCRVGDFELLRCIKVSDIAEVYQAAASDRLAAIKIGRPGVCAPMTQMLENETRLLQRLDGTVTPGFLAQGEFEGRPYFANHWIDGAAVSHVAHVLRKRNTAEARCELAELCHRCALAYAQLHRQGVVHGDVHTGNLLVDNTAHAWIIDLGLARFIDEAGIAPHRGGVGAFLEPEYARAILAGTPIPSATPEGEQYAIACLIYSLLTGKQYLEFSLEREEMFRQIASDMPRRLIESSGAWWPEAEPVLLRALAKEPASRHATVEIFSEALRDAVDSCRMRLRPPRPTAQNMRASGKTDPYFAGRDTLTRDLVEMFRARSGSVQEIKPEAPTSSVSHGAAGIAYGLWQLSCRWQDPSLLSLANVWQTQAVSQLGDEDAFCTKDDGLTSAVIGKISPFHTESGIHCVSALIAKSMCDVAAHRAAVRAFLSASEASCSSLDLTLGRSGTLLACSMMIEAADDDDRMIEPLRSFGDAVISRIWTELQDCVPLCEGPPIRHLGVAHGWSGMAYAAMRWCRATASPIPQAVEERLQQLAEVAEPVGRGCRWPWTIGRNPRSEGRVYMPGWCNGTAGFVHVWVLAYETLREPRYLQLAEQAAWNAFVEPGTNVNLCCGLAGRAYALLSLYKLTQEREWLNRAETLAERARLSAQDERMLDAYSVSALERRQHSLYKGNLGLVLLLEDLASPDESSMPFFESHGWS